MPLVASALSSSLASSWLVPDGGSYPSSPDESADHFAGAVSSWFAGALAGGFPCSTATARRSQLQGLAASAIQAKDPQLAGTQLALALLAYMTAQSFGSGVASPPVAMSAAQSAISAVFADLNSGLNARADQIAQGIYAMAISTVVVFPPPLPPSPVS